MTKQKYMADNGWKYKMFQRKKVPCKTVILKSRKSVEYIEWSTVITASKATDYSDLWKSP